MTHFWCDGSGWNLKESKYCILVDDGSQPIIQKYEKEYTNNEMEYMAIYEALWLAQKGDIIYTDSRLVKEQVCGNWRLKAQNLKQLYLNCKKLCIEKQIKIEWVPREKNKAGLILEGKLQIKSCGDGVNGNTANIPV